MWDEAYQYWWWLDRYGLTPAQVDDLPAAMHARIPLIAAEADTVRQEAQEAASRGR